MKPKPTYVIGADDGGQYIRCTVCNLRSYHPKDIEKRYCGNCHRFHCDIDIRRRNDQA